MLQLANQARFPLFGMSYIIGQIQQAQSGAKGFFEVLETKPRVVDKESAKELKDVKDRAELEEKNRIADAEYERVRHSKMTPEELEQEKKDRERIDRMAALYNSGYNVSDEEWRSGVLNKDKVIETRPDTSEFADPEEL